MEQEQTKMEFEQTQRIPGNPILAKFLIDAIRKEEPKRTQQETILVFLHDAMKYEMFNNGWVPAAEMARLIGYEWHSRLTELRKMGFRIDKSAKRVPGKKYFAYKIVYE